MCGRHTTTPLQNSMHRLASTLWRIVCPACNYSCATVKVVIVICILAILCYTGESPNWILHQCVGRRPSSLFMGFPVYIIRTVFALIQGCVETSSAKGAVTYISLSLCVGYNLHLGFCLHRRESGISSIAPQQA